MSISRIFTGLIRILTGGLFIFSGMVKADDPTGFSYKLHEYFVVFENDTGLAFTALNDYAIYISIVICIVEITLGVMLLLGIFRWVTTVKILALMIFFTFLTGYSAIGDKVKDCGCFGDFIKLTPWESFYKDIALTVAALILYFNRDLIKPVFSPGLRYTLFIAGLAGATGFTYYCYHYLPVWDFRPYHVGADLQEQMKLPQYDPATMTPEDSIALNGGKRKTVMVYKHKETGAEKQLVMISGERDDLAKIYEEDSNFFNTHNMDTSYEEIYIQPREPKIVDFKISRFYEMQSADGGLTQPQPPAPAVPADTLTAGDSTTTAPTDTLTAAADSVRRVDTTQLNDQIGTSIIVDKNKTLKNAPQEEGNPTDLTDNFLAQKGYRLVIVHKKLSTDDAKANTEGQAEMNDLITALLSIREQTPVWGLTAASEQLAKEYKEKYNVPYELYLCDQTVLKTIIRSNPGLLLIKDNKIVAKWPYTDLPEIKELKNMMKVVR